MIDECCGAVPMPISDWLSGCVGGMWPAADAGRTGLEPPPPPPSAPLRPAVIDGRQPPALRADCGRSDAAEIDEWPPAVPGRPPPHA